MTGPAAVTEAIILAGGLGTRLRSVVPDRPKPMADVGGRPFLAYLLGRLARHGVVRAILAIGYQHDIIVNYFGSQYNDVLLDPVVEAEPRGTGGALLDALGRVRTDRVLVLNGDTFFDVDLGALAAYHAAQNAEITMAVKPLRDAGRYGTVVVEDGRISGFREKQRTAPGLINGGVYIVERALAGSLRQFSGPFSFERDFLEPRSGSLRAFAFVSDAYFIDIGIPEDYERARRELPTLPDRV